MDAAARTTTEPESTAANQTGQQHEASGVSSGEVAVAIPDTHAVSDAAATAPSDDFAGRVRAAHVALEVTGAKEESREFLIAVRIKAGAREFIKKTPRTRAALAPGLFCSQERPRRQPAGGIHRRSPLRQSRRRRHGGAPRRWRPSRSSTRRKREDKVDSEGVDVDPRWIRCRRTTCCGTRATSLHHDDRRSPVRARHRPVDKLNANLRSAA